MRTRTVRLLSAVAALGALPLTASSAQQSAAPPGQLNVGPAVGAEAPDFEFKGITKYGALEKSAKLSDFRGQTVVLAFFPKARTKG
jgi:peroxiredoxin Q/BCP